MSEVTGRTLLLNLGVGDFNATMIIPYLSVSPMTTDPKSPQIMVLVKAMQKQLNLMGANIVVSSYLDRSTADALSQVCGSEDWSRWSWSDVIATVLAAKSTGNPMPLVQSTPNLSATGDFVAIGDDAMPFGLPTVPGGVMTYAVGAAALVYLLSKKKGRR